ncbi:MAG TPA: hypothetical protein VLT33_47180 [Labilithrix sp.]|nr:hypothetical protein [Labilithrix sp.]
MSIRHAIVSLTFATLMTAVVACESDSTSNQSPLGNPNDASFGVDSSVDGGGPGPVVDSAVPDAPSDASDGGKVLADGMLEPIPYLSRADSPFKGVAFPAYSHFEDFEDHLLNTPGVTSDMTSVSSAFGPSLIDSIDGDDGTVDGKCTKVDGTCDAAFGNGSITFTFDAGILGALPTHVGLAWTDGSPQCDAVFEAYDGADVLIGTKTATKVGDADNLGGTAEDRFFGVVHGAGVKKVIIRSSSGGVEADHLTYGR